MPNKSYSRRRFLGNIAAGSTGAALASLPGGHSASAGGAVADPPYPVTMVSYPLYAASGPFPLENIKIVTTDVIPKSDEEKLQSFSPTLKLHQCRSFEEFHREVVDAHVIFADFTRKDFAAAKQLRWIQTRAAGVEELVVLAGACGKPRGPHQHAKDLRSWDFRNGDRTHPFSCPWSE